jgi:hypothetical protein
LKVNRRFVRTYLIATCFHSGFSLRLLFDPKDGGNMLLRNVGWFSTFDGSLLWYYFFYLACEAIGTAATPGLLCQLELIVKMIVEKQMECRLAGKTKVLGENLPRRHFCPSQNPTWPDPGLNPGRRGEKPATHRPSYGATFVPIVTGNCVKLRTIFLNAYRRIQTESSDNIVWIAENDMCLRKRKESSTKSRNVERLSRNIN